MSLTVWVDAVGIAAPGLADWPQARAVLLGEQACVADELPAYSPSLLPPNERRRATPSVRQAFRAAEDAMQRASIPASELASVFSTSDADLGIIQRISQALTEVSRPVSPTDFHNSVHNAAAGYWSIATGSRLPSSTVCAYDAGFAAGLFEAAMFIAAEKLPTLLVCYDVPGPPLLQAQRPFGCAASTALVLRTHDSDGQRALARLEISLIAGEETKLVDPALEALRLANPALRALSLLHCLAMDADGSESVLALPGHQALRVVCHAP